jgi:hypothetical protein
MGGSLIIMPDENLIAELAAEYKKRSRSLISYM